jgi:hypothetical protein
MLTHNKVTLNISKKLAVEYRTLEAPGLENQVCCTKTKLPKWWEQGSSNQSWTFFLVFRRAAFGCGNSKWASPHMHMMQKPNTVHPLYKSYMKDVSVTIIYLTLRESIICSLLSCATRLMPLLGLFGVSC